VSHRRPPVAVRIDTSATTLITAAAAASHPRETGGVLLGWWDVGAICVRRAVEVRDPLATATSWNRDQQAAQAALDITLTDDPHPWLGYVGDWHTHPAACGPTRHDLAEIRRISRQYPQPLLLLIHRADSRFDQVVAHRGRTRTASLIGSASGTTMATEGPAPR
jgi:proteasome lid subunit RPN8/RPN11